MSTAHRPEPRPSESGFTLIEVLVALVLVAFSLSSIESLMAANTRTVRNLNEHLAMISVARTVETMIPDPGQRETGDSSGMLDGYDWRIDFRPFTAAGLRPSPTWAARTAVITVTSPSGAVFTFDTVRLSRNLTQ